MTVRQCQALFRWFSARPRARRALAAANFLLPLFSLVLYPVLLVLLAARLISPAGRTPEAAAELARAVLVPGAVFWGGTALRRALNWPRPYERPGVQAVLPKHTRGAAFPSRHALSAGVIAAVWLHFSLPVGLFLTAAAAGVCAARVLALVHSPRDVLAGGVAGFALGLLGMNL